MEKRVLLARPLKKHQKPRIILTVSCLKNNPLLTKKIYTVFIMMKRTFLLLLFLSLFFGGMSGFATQARADDFSDAEMPFDVSSLKEIDFSGLRQRLGDVKSWDDLKEAGRFAYIEAKKYVKSREFKGDEILELEKALVITGRKGLSNEVKSDQTRVRLAGSRTRVGLHGEQYIGLQFLLFDGWKIYWRFPGDAGYPPRIDWTGSENLAAHEMFFPTPKRFSFQGIEMFGYGKEVTFPIRIKAEDKDKPLHLKARVDYLICKDICIPDSATLTLDLPVGDGMPTAVAGRIRSAYTRLPRKERDDIFFKEAVFEVLPSGTYFTVAYEMEGAPENPDIFLEDKELRLAPPTRSIINETILLRSKIRPETIPDEGLEGWKTTFTLADGWRAIEVETTPALVTEPYMPKETTHVILWIAFLGGLLLNVMPCVLPVLSMKLVGFISFGTISSRAVRLSFLATTAGILSSFWALAAGIMLLKATGHSFGWGMQFQAPFFLMFMAVVLALFTTNLLGCFTLSVPSFAHRFLERFSVDPKEGDSLAGHFLTGMLATLLATPCSAPFLGTAVGFALAENMSAIPLIFTMLGLGFASPYLILAAMPGMARYFPRPGPWMRSVKYGCAVLLCGTLIWILYLLSTKLATAGLVMTVVALVSFMGGMLIWRKQMPATAFYPTGRLALLFSGLLILPFIFLALFLTSPSVQTVSVDTQETQTVEDGLIWHPFDRAEIDRLVADGRVVFVDLTADWCVTCQWNKLRTFTGHTFKEAVQNKDVYLMRGDWTHPNKALEAYMAEFNRSGVPLNIFHSPLAPEGTVLPTLLSIRKWKEALGYVSEK